MYQKEYGFITNFFGYLLIGLAVVGFIWIMSILFPHPLDVARKFKENQRKNESTVIIGKIKSIKNTMILHNHKGISGSKKPIFITLILENGKEIKYEGDYEFKIGETYEFYNDYNGAFYFESIEK